MSLINEVLANLTWFNLFVLTVGSYSITRLLVTDSFPLFERPRQWLFKNYPPEGFASQSKPPRGVWRKTSNNIYVVDEGHWLGELLSCPWCAGWWVSLAVYIGFVFAPAVTVFILVPFTMRAIVGGYANKIGGG
jgi:hypothetical protein